MTWLEAGPKAEFFESKLTLVLNEMPLARSLCKSFFSLERLEPPSFSDLVEFMLAYGFTILFL